MFRELGLTPKLAADTTSDQLLYDEQAYSNQLRIQRKVVKLLCGKIMGYKLVLKATLEGITDLSPKDSEQSPFEYTFEIECTSCREKHDKEITINRFELHEMSGSRGEANFVFKCKNCKVS